MHEGEKQTPRSEGAAGVFLESWHTRCWLQDAASVFRFFSPPFEGVFLLSSSKRVGVCCLT